MKNQLKKYRRVMPIYTGIELTPAIIEQAAKRPLPTTLPYRLIKLLSSNRINIRVISQYVNECCNRERVILSTTTEVIQWDIDKTRWLMVDDQNNVHIVKPKRMHWDYNPIDPVEPN